METIKFGSADYLEGLSRDELLAQYALQSGGLHALVGLQQVGVTLDNLDTLLAGIHRVLAFTEQIVSDRALRDPAEWPEWARQECPTTRNAASGSSAGGKG